MTTGWVVLVGVAMACCGNGVVFELNQAFTRLVFVFLAPISTRVGGSFLLLVDLKHKIADERLGN